MTVTSDAPNPTISSRAEIDLMALVGTLWRGKWWIILWAVMAGLLGGYYAFFQAVPQYTASAQIAFESREEQIIGLEGVIGGLGGDLATINTEVEVLRSRGLMRKVITELDLVQDPEFNSTLRPDRPYSFGSMIGTVRNYIFGTEPEPVVYTDEIILNKAIDVLLSKLTNTNIRQSYVFQITAVTENPEKSALIANTVAQTYIIDQIETKFEATEQATQWLSDRVGELQTELEIAVEAVKDFNSGSQVVSEDRLDALNNQLKDLRERHAETEATIAMTHLRVDALEAARHTADFAQMEIVAQDRALSRAYSMISDGTEAGEATFNARYEQVLERTRADLNRAVEQQSAFAISIETLEMQIAEQSADLVTLQQLEREAEASQLIYESFLARLKETSVQQGIQQADSRVLSSAVVPLNASAPRKPVILALCLFLGSVIGAGIVLVRELTHNAFRSAEELESLTGYRVLGQIPVIPSRGRSNILKYLSDRPASAASEAIRNLRTSTLLSNGDVAPKVIMSTSSIPGEGKTTQSVSLAQNLSGLGKRVLLIEGDIRRSTFTEYFGVRDGTPGLASVVSGDAVLEDVVVHHDQLGADILVGESSAMNAADMFSMDGFRTLVETARGQYDYVVIDTPPVLLVPDARVIGQSADAILYSVRWDKTTKRQVREGLKNFESVGLRVTGVVLCQISSKGMRQYGYGDSYGAYNSYSRSYYVN
ncbi:MAG: polysaccharide biosynthesis tyrosine autokinase [Pseudomonadota bacterium]